MKTLELLAALSERNVQLWTEGDQLRYRAPKGVLNAEFRDLLSRKKGEVMDLLRRRDRESVSLHPLSYAQEGLWFMNQAMPGSTAFNVGFAFRIRSTLDIAALKRVVQALMDRHPMLRTTYSDSNGEAVQYIHGCMQSEFNEVDASRWNEEEMQQRVIEAHKQLFELEQGPLLRVFLFCRSESDYVFLMVGHHIAIDGWSVRVLLDEMRTLYSSQTIGDTDALPLPEVNYTDYVQWQTEMLAGPKGESHWAYWKKQLDGELTPVNLPGRGSQMVDLERRGVSHNFTLNQDLTAQLKSLARAEGATLFTILLAVYLVLLYRYSGQEDILVISPAAGRSRPEFARIIGCLANLMILRFRISGEMTFKELLKQTQITILEALDHQDFPFELLPERLQKNSIFSRSALFRVGFALQRPHQPDDFSTFLGTEPDSNRINFGGIELEPYYIPQGEGHVDLGLDMADDGKGLLWGSLKHDANVIDVLLASQMLGHFKTLLESATTHSTARLWELPLLSDAERHQLLVVGNQTGKEYPKDKTIVHLFEDQVERSPEAIAVTYEDTRLTYRELNLRANRLAQRLMMMGVKPEVMVGLYMERSVEMVIGILGILKAGGAYVPLDPVYPKDRLSFMVQDAHMPVVVTTHNLSKEFTLGGTARCLTIDEPDLAVPVDNPPCAVVPENTAYVIYTSGSTGKPKGVLVTHHNVVRLFKATDQWFHFNEKDIWTLFHSYAFDFSVWELWGALLYGGKLVVVPYLVSRSPESFLDLLGKQRVTILNQTPSAFRQLIQADLNSPEPIDLALRFVIFGGEALELQSLKPWFDRHGDQEPCLINMYGITETTVHVTYRPIKKVDLESGFSSAIGVPIPDLQVYVLDAHRQLVPMGVPGELYIGGQGVSRGYLNRGDLTSSRFISDPFCTKPGARLYRTGDLARRLSNGDLEYLGRIDQQVKIRGFRVELGEIEARINDLDAVSACVVILREDRPDDQRLVAYYILKPGCDVSISDWRTYLGSNLPDYMVPQHFVELASIPLTSNGKVDRGALPIPEADSAMEQGYVAPRTEIEQKIAAIWQRVLNHEKVGVYNNFFELGGHSLLTAQLLSRLREAFPVNLPLRNLFEATTVAEQGQLIETLLWASQKNEPIGPRRSGFASGDRDMSLLELLAEIRKKDTNLRVDGDKLRVDAPDGVLTDDLIQVLQKRKTEIIRFLSTSTLSDGNPALLQLPRIVKISRNERLPLSFAQERLWFLCQLDPDSTAYSMPGSLRLRGRLDTEALERSFLELARRHETLRTTFRFADGRPEQIISFEPAVALEKVDLCALPVAVRDKEAARLAEEQSRKPFDLVSGPLFRATLYKLGDEDHMIHTNMHHIIADYWSFGVMIREFVEFYGAFVAGTTPQLPELPVQYADFSYCQRKWLQGEVLETHLSYWKEKLGGELATLDLPTDRPRPAMQTHRSAKASLIVEQGLVGALRELSRRQGASLFMVLLAAFKALLVRYTGQEDILVGTPIAGRNRTELEGVIGFFINTIVMRNDLSGNPTFKELLERVRKTALEAYAHQEMPFEKIVEELAPKRDLSHTPLFQVFFNYIVAEDYQAELPGFTVETFGDPEYESKFDITLYVWEQDDAIRLTALYNADLFDARRIARMLKQYAALLEQVTKKPEEKIFHYSLLTSVEAKLLPDPTRPLTPQWTGPVHERFSKQAFHAPGQTAVVDASVSWSYGELERYSNQLAGYIRSKGIESGDVVAIYGHRSAGLVLALLSVLKAGAAFLLLDPQYPASRLIKMLEQASPRGWLQVEAAGPVADELVAFLDACQVVCRLGIPQAGEGVEDLLQGMPSGPLENTVAPDDTAYIIFTSGTTGQPKGIVGTHRPLSHFLEWHCREFELDRSDRFSMLSGLSHDPLMRDIFTPFWVGATLCIPGPDNILIPDRLGAWMEAQQISVAHMTPALGWLLTEAATGAASGKAKLSALRYVFFGGDILTRHHVERIHAIAPRVTCVDYYGTTETPQAMGYYLVENHEDDTSGERIPLGKGIEGVQLLVLNAAGQLAGVGELGEIYVRTPYLTRGYLNDEALTCERFIQNPINRVHGDSMYKTGDLGRYLSDGNVMFHGRADRQVSIRGFRAELKDIEAILAKHPDIPQCAVVDRNRESGDRYLAAYVVISDSKRADFLRLAQYVGKHLPDYMIPSAFIQLGEMPLTPNGKVDLAALPAPEGHEILLNKDMSPPRSPYEMMLLDIWSEVLHLKNIGIHDNFFHLGGHSLMATQVVSRIREIFDTELPLRVLFEFPTISGIANQLKERSSGKGFSEVCHLKRLPRNQPLPLSYSQERMWFLQQLIPDQTAYNMGGAFEAHGDFQPQIFYQVLDALSRKHESLRTVFIDADGTPLQKILPEPSFSFEVIEMDSTQGLEKRRQKAMAEGAAVLAEPFDLASGPLMRVSVYALSVDLHIVFYAFHHIITDLWSSGILGHEVLNGYQTIKEGRIIDVAHESIDYADYANLQRRWFNSDVIDSELSFWKEKLKSLPVLELPTDKIRPPQLSGKGQRRIKSISNELIRQVKRSAAEATATPFMVLLSAFYILLWRYSGQTDLAVGFPIANRTRKETEKIVGTFVNTLVLRCDLSEKPCILDLIRQVRREALLAYEHQDMPFEKLVEELQPERDLSHAPLVQVLFNVANAPTANFDGRDLPKWEPLPVDRGAAQFDITLAIDLESGGLLVEYTTDLFTGETIERMIDHYLTILNTMVEDADMRISDIPLLSEKEEHQLLRTWNRTEADFDLETPVSRRFEEQAVVFKDKPAAYFGDGALTYDQLNRRSNRIAHFIQSQNIGADAFVGIYMERSLEMLVVLLGVMKSGAAYLPLDPAFPEDRINFMIEDSGAPLIFSQEKLAATISGHDARVVCYDPDALGTEIYSDKNLDVTPLPESLAYVIYTSGSTGLPKGVQISNRALVNFLLTMQEQPGLSPEDVVLAETTLSFDIAGLELFLPLITGATIALADKETGYDGTLMQHAIDRFKATVLQATPASWRILIESGWQGSPNLKALCGGEAMPRELAAQLLCRCKELWNMYGPTETTIWSTVCRIETIDEPILIGKPIANTTIYILDDKLRPAPIGVPGELHIGGDGLARGYLNRESLTAEKFIISPFDQDSRTRIYKTGDLARYRADGQIECLGRLDHQVKIRGFRIELGEIETRLSEYDAVRKNVVVAREDRPGDVYLAGYIVTEPNEAITAEKLRSHLRKSLPDYMVPATFTFLEELPLTPNGKIDRRALPTPDVNQQTDACEPLPPRTPMEETIAAVWREVLGVDQIGVYDNFFSLGGHSLMATRLVAKLRNSEIEINISVRSIFENPTIAELAEAITLDMLASEDASMIAELLKEIENNGS